MIKRKMTHTLWTTLEKSMLRGMLGKNLTYEEIAKSMGKTRQSVAHMSQRMGLSSDGHRKYTDEFKKVVYEFYLTSNAKETREKFSISQGTLEAFVTKMRLYDDKSKDIKKNQWSQAEILFLLKYTGLQPVSFISGKLGRTEASIKSYFKRKGFRLHYVNGLKKEEAEKFNPKVKFYVIERYETLGIFKRVQTTRIDHYFRPIETIPFLRNRMGEIILPWTTAEDNMHKMELDQIQRKIISSMARFQRFLHGAESNKEMSEKLFNLVTE